MKTASTAFSTHLSQDLTTTAYLIRMTRTDGVVLGFTTADKPIVMDDVTYRAATALSPSHLRTSSGLSTDSLDLAGIIDDDELSESDIAAGLYDHARVDIFLCNWADISQGCIHLRRGWIGQVTRNDDYYAAEIRGLHDLLQRPLGSFYTAECRHSLGDTGCGVDLSSLTVTGQVTGVNSSTEFSDTSRTETDKWFSYALLTWQTGANAGMACDVKSWDSDTQSFTVWLPPPFSISIGDTYSVHRGCDRRFTTCKNTFSNATNFGGFPYLPGINNLLKYPQS